MMQNNSNSNNNNTSSYTLDQAIQLNNSGVRHAIAGRDKQAAALFSNSLSVFNALSFNNTNASSSSATRISTRVSSLVPNSIMSKTTTTLHEKKTPLPQLDETTTSNNNSNNSKHDESEETRYFLFNKVISLARVVAVPVAVGHGMTPAVEEYSAADIHVYCSVILFNIALIYHRQAVTKQKNGTEDATTSLLVKAERFYERAIQLIPEQEEQQVGTGMMVKLVATNNQSLIRLVLEKRGDNNVQQQQQQPSKAGIERLTGFLLHQKFTLADANDDDDTANNNTFLSKRELQGMLLNSIVLAAATAGSSKQEEEEHSSSGRRTPTPVAA